MEKDQKLEWAIAWVLRETRESANLTQGQLAGFSGLSESYVALVEQAASGVSIASLVRMAAVLKVSPSELMRRIEVEIERGPRNPERTPGRPRKNIENTS
jgi:transcriptional regulator with XRE-family HTH domain